MKFAFIGFVQKDILNPATLGINPSSYYISEIEDYISHQMTEDNGYLNVVYSVLSNGQKEDNYSKSKFAHMVKDPFCIELTEGYNVDIDLSKQAPIPRYYVKTSDFDIFDESLQVLPYRISGEFVAHIVGSQPSFSKVLNQNVQMGFNQYEIIGAWLKDSFISTVRKMLERGAYVDVVANLVVCEQDWRADLEENCQHFIQTGQLSIK